LRAGRRRQLVHHHLAEGGVAVGGLGVEADDEPLVITDLDLFDLQVVGHLLVAARPGEGRLGVGGPRPQPLAEDVAVPTGTQVTPVGRGGEPAVADPHDTRQGPLPQVVLGLPDQRGVGGVPRPGPHPHRDAGAGDRHPDHDLGQVTAGVLAVAPGTEPRLARLFLFGVGRVCGGLGRGLAVGQHLAAGVAGHRRVGVGGLEVGAGGVEEQQVDLEVEQRGHRPEDFLLYLRGGLDQPVHRPVALVLADPLLAVGEAGDERPSEQPRRGGQLAGRLDRPRGDQREQHPLGAGVSAGAGQ
jgi:hypothetical protein